MQKTLYLVGGPMGVGKFATCRLLERRLPACAFLDGVWCWEMHPFTVTDETKAMALDNICHILNNFLACSAYENVVFCRGMHEQAILDTILARLRAEGTRVVAVSLTCAPDELERRLQRDIDAGLRAPDVLPRALERLTHYSGALKTHKLDTTRLTPLAAAQALINL